MIRSELSGLPSSRFVDVIIWVTEGATPVSLVSVTGGYVVGIAGLQLTGGRSLLR